MVERNYFRMMSDEEALRCKFDFCKDCPFYECELVEEYAQFRKSHTQIHKSQMPVVDADILSYDQSKLKLKDGCFMSCRHVDQIECGRRTVTEGIDDHYKIEIDDDGNIKKGVEDKWEPLQPVFISAQTGQGKNYFIENELIPYVRQLNYANQKQQRVLILSNRLALKQQIKNRIDGNDDLDDEAGEIFYPYREFVDVMTYQGLLRWEKYLKKKQREADLRYIYVICDEAHFFTSDAMFNPHTQKILQAIVRLFQNAVRIYMSATPYECLEYIIKCENEEQDRLNLKQYGEDQDKWKTGRMVFYHFKRDYSYLDVKTYSSIRELYGEIVERVNKNGEKWLIFIDDKEKCARVKAQLEEFAKDRECPLEVEDTESKEKVEKVFAVDADSKKESTYQEIVKNERLNKDTYVLLSTSVLDNGINLVGIKNIVVSDMEKVKCLQMVGRARVKGNDDRKNLYIKRFSEGEVEKRIKDSMRQQDAYHSYEMAYDELRDISQPSGEYKFLSKYYNGNDSDWRDAKRWFGISHNKSVKFYLNGIAKSLLDRHIPCYEFILDEMADESSKEDERQNEKKHIGQKYLEYQLSWFGKVYFEDNDITFVDKEKSKKDLIAFLEGYVVDNREMDKNGQKIFRTKFTELCNAAFGRKDPNKERIYSITKINSILEEESINYKVVSHSSNWVVEKCNWENEDSE